MARCQRLLGGELSSGTAPVHAPGLPYIERFSPFALSARVFVEDKHHARLAAPRFASVLLTVAVAQLIAARIAADSRPVP